MSRTIYALLVGIDDYEYPVPKLRGCVNDIDAFAGYLRERVANDHGVALSLMTLKDAEAKREAVIEAFRDHLGQAKEGDVALFYYSGHGSQERAPEEFWTLEPDHLDETLVLFDSRSEGSWDLADKEIARLIGELAAGGAHVAVILDCCHSGSATRNAEEPMVVRRAPTDLRDRPIGSFLVTAAEAQAAAATRAADGSTTGWYTPPQGRHVLLAACRDDQEASEYVGNGQHRGAFSYFLGEALRSASGVPTYRDLYSRTSAGVSTAVRNQTPELEAARTEDLQAVFLDGTLQPAPATFTASYRDGSWTVDGGAAGGVPAPAGNDFTRLALYPFDATASDLSDPARKVATARVIRVLPTSGILEVEDPAPLDPAATYKARILSVPTPPLVVRLEGDAAAYALVREALKTASPEGGPSPFIREATGEEVSEFRLIARDGQFAITRTGDDHPLVRQIDGLDRAGARRAVEQLEHIARWVQTRGLSNPTSSIRPGDVTLSIVVDGKDVSDAEVRLEYKLRGAEQVAPTIRLGLRNNSDRTLYCGLLDLTQRFGIFAGLLDEGCVKLAPGAEAWGNQGKEIEASVSDEEWKQGVIESRDLLKCIVCTQEFDARLLEQPSLDVPRLKAAGTTRGGTGAAGGGSLDRLMRKVQARDLAPAEPKVLDDWQSFQVAFTTVRLLPSTPVPAAGQVAISLGQGVTLEPHPALKAQARLSSTPLATRDLGNVTLPRLLYDDPSACQPLTFTATRGTSPGLSVLELTDVNDASLVTPSAPLRLSVPVGLRPDEHVVPVAYDGEFFLPLGRVERRGAADTVIALDRLPPPLADSRSLTGAIKIFFQKAIAKVTGLEFGYPVLAVADFAADGTLKQTRGPAEVRDRVAKAQKILLFIHGIIGETDTMAPSVRLATSPDGQPVSSLYDLVLTFDYENLGTTIEENGRLLKDRLAAVGLAAGHGKVLDIAAHSMGGLVSRWFIEREGGNQVVRRLVMLGTPNGGSPWPKVVDWATLALSFGLNQLTRIPWPSSVVGWLSRYIENPTTALDEMIAGSEVLTELSKSGDPGIPYLMVAGKTSLIPAATAPAGAGKPSLFARLVSRVTSPAFLHEVANPFFLDQDNDVAVSVASMENVPAARARPLDVRPVACDHMSYFRDVEGLKAFAEVLAKST